MFEDDTLPPPIDLEAAFSASITSSLEYHSRTLRKPVFSGTRFWYFKYEHIALVVGIGQFVWLTFIAATFISPIGRRLDVWGKSSLLLAQLLITGMAIVAAIIATWHPRRRIINIICGFIWVISAAIFGATLFLLAALIHW